MSAEAPVEATTAAGALLDADLVIAGATLITLNAARDVIEDGALAIRATASSLSASARRWSTASAPGARWMGAASSPRRASSTRTSTSPAIR